MKHVSNTDKIPFKDMTPEERSIIANAWMEDKLEAFHDGIGWQDVNSTDCLSLLVTYRTKPKQLVIPWEHIKPEYKWAAMDADSLLYFYENLPISDMEDNMWDSGGSICRSPLKIDTDGINWQDSLVQRPKGV